MGSASNEVVVRQELFGRLSLDLMRQDVLQAILQDQTADILGSK